MLFRLRIFVFIIFTLMAIEYSLNWRSYITINGQGYLNRDFFKSRAGIFLFSECPVIPPTLQGRVLVNTSIQEWSRIEKDNSGVLSGGRYKPPDCIARNRVAIIIPYRDRENQLKIFLQHMHAFLQRQQLDYGIYVVEMTHERPFNRAVLMNIGFAEAMEEYDYQCFIFHDVDLIPEDDRNLYTCPSMPRHMATAMDKFKYKLAYPTYFGGVSAIPTNQFILINGFSNEFFGWGGEDDDMFSRIRLRDLSVLRYYGNFARYKMLKHKQAPLNPKRFKLLRKSRRRQSSDGLSNLKYRLIKLEKKPLYTWIYVSVSILEEMKKTNSSHQQQRNQHSVIKQFRQSKQPSRNEGNGIDSVRGNTTVKRNVVHGHKKPSVINVGWVPADYKGQIPNHLKHI